MGLSWVLSLLGQKEGPSTGKRESLTPRKLTVPRVEDMTLDEKIGQMTQVDHLALGDGEDVARCFIGSVLSGGGGAPVWGNSAKDWADLIDHFQSQSLKTRLKVPIMYGVDAIHGHSNVVGATIFPHNIGLGTTRNPQLASKRAKISGIETAATGIRWVFSPSVSVCRDSRWGRCYESLGEETELVRAFTGPIIRGLQSWPTELTNVENDNAASSEEALSREIFVAATAKHFVGDGGTVNGTDQGDMEITENELRAIHLPPYLDAIESNVQTIMVSYSSWKGLKMHGNHHLITKVLKEELGFKGFVVSDWEAIKQLPGNYEDQVRTSVNAGIDMIMVPTAYKEFIRVLKNEVLEGRVSMERIDDAVSRILKVKKSLGLFENPCAHRKLLPVVGSKAHREVAREAVRESLVLLKNKRRSNGGSMFPLPLKNARMLLTGSHVHDLGLQCGGRTIQWQGAAGDITVGTTILEGVTEVTQKYSESVQHIENPNGTEQLDYAIVAVGEQPYAEGQGDRQELELDVSSRELIKCIGKNMPCIVIIVSGRPLEISEILPFCDAVVAVWLPGSEGGRGISDVLFEDYDFKGRLPRTWLLGEADSGIMSQVNEVSQLDFGFGLNKRGERLPCVDRFLQNSNSEKSIDS